MYDPYFEVGQTYIFRFQGEGRKYNGLWVAKEETPDGMVFELAGLEMTLHREMYAKAQEAVIRLPDRNRALRLFDERKDSNQSRILNPIRPEENHYGNLNPNQTLSNEELTDALYHLYPEGMKDEP